MQMVFKLLTVDFRLQRLRRQPRRDRMPELCTMEMYESLFEHSDIAAMGTLLLTLMTPPPRQYRFARNFAFSMKTICRVAVQQGQAR